jgi:hypothetical protein
MDVLQIDGKEIPLLEAPQGYDDPPRRILYVLFKHTLMICVIFYFADCDFPFSGPTQEADQIICQRPPYRYPRVQMVEYRLNFA